MSYYEKKKRSKTLICRTIVSYLAVHTLPSQQHHFMSVWWMKPTTDWEMVMLTSHPRLSVAVLSVWW